MDINRIISDVTAYAQANPVGSIAAGVIFLLLLIKKPKLFFLLLILVAVGVGVIHIFDKISSTGISNKEFNSLGELK